MRTRVSLDNDVVFMLKRVACELGVSFKKALNDAVRAGLGGDTRASRRYRMPTRRMGVKRGVDLDRALLLAGELEDAETVST
jgi:hypothetical protein